MIGHIKIDRKILNWEWYHDLKVFHLFLYLLLKANHKDGRWQGNDIKRGQVITGRLKISKETRLTDREIRTCINKLKSTGEIAVKTTSKFSIITICKYDYYQSFDKRNDQHNDQQIDQQIDQQTTNKRPTNDQQTTTNNNGNNDKKKNNEKEIKGNPLWFLKFYHSTYEVYKNTFNGQSTTEEYFLEWKKFIDFIYEKRYEDLFDCKFLSPHDYAKLKTTKNFTEDKWDDILKMILSSGVKQEHNLFFRIPQFMQYKKDGDKIGINDSKDVKIKLK